MLLKKKLSFFIVRGVMLYTTNLPCGGYATLTTLKYWNLPKLTFNGSILASHSIKVWSSIRYMIPMSLFFGVGSRFASHSFTLDVAKD